MDQENQTMVESRFLRQAAVLCAGGAALLGALGLLGWMSGELVLARIDPSYIPMAPNTAVVFVALGLILLARVRRTLPVRARVVIAAVVALASIYGLLKFIGYFTKSDLTFESLLFPVTNKLGSFPIGRMSPITGILFGLAGFALLLTLTDRPGDLARDVVAVLGGVVLVAGFVATVGYFFGTPLLYGGDIIPLAATTAAAFLLLGCGLVAAAGPASILLRPIVGPSIRARLLRAFLPLTAAVVLVQGLSQEITNSLLGVNHALVSASVSLIFAAMAAVAVTRVAQFVSSTVDRAEAERQRAEEERLKFVLGIERSSDAVFMTKTDGTIIYVNPGFEQMYGWSKAEVLGQTPRILKSGVESEQVYARLWKTLLDKRVIAGEIVNKTRDGRLISVESSANPIVNERGELIGFLAVQHDITERKRAEQALRESEERLRTVVSNAPVVLFALDRDGVFTLSEGKGLEALGVKPGQVVGQSVFDVYRDVPEIVEYNRRALAGEAFSSQVRVGNLIFDTWYAPIKNQQGQVQGVIGISTNITERKRAEEQTHLQLRRLSALHAIDIAITGNFDLRVIFNVFLEQVTTQLGVDAAAVLLLNAPMQTLDYIAGRGFRFKEIERARVRLGGNYAGKAAIQRSTVHIDRRELIEDAPAFLAMWQREDFVSYYAVPLIAKGQVKGVLEVFRRAALDPDQDWLPFLETLGTQAAIAIENTSLFADLQHSNLELTLAYDTTLEGWSRALDLRDKETEGHTERVVDQTLRLARLFGIGDTEVIHVRRGALLHDIGKMGIPDGILLKPGALTVQEWEIMRKHPVYAYELLSPIAFLHPALDIPYCHHERWDGTGYPRGLKGNEIPLVARIFAVVDVWDALCSDRPYRMAWSERQAREHIRAESGKHFDPKVVDAFLSMLDSG